MGHRWCLPGTASPAYVALDLYYISWSKLGVPAGRGVRAHRHFPWGKIVALCHTAVFRCPEACWIKAPETYYRLRVKLHSPKTGLFEVNRLATASCQSIATFQQNCHACRLHLERVIARIGGSFSGYFLSYSTSPVNYLKPFSGLRIMKFRNY